MHLVQFAGPIQPAWLDALAATGVRVVTYIPSNAYLVYADAGTIDLLRRWAATDAHVQWEAPYLDKYRIDPAAAAMAANPALANARNPFFAVQLVRDAPVNRATLVLLGALRTGPVAMEWDILDFHNVIVPFPPGALPRIAARPDVISIQPWSPPILFDERQDQIVAGNITGNVPTGPGYLAWVDSKGFTQAQFAASGFAVDISDSGIDNGTTSPNHFGLYEGGLFTGASRVTYNRVVGGSYPTSALRGCDEIGRAHV